MGALQIVSIVQTIGVGSLGPLMISTRLRKNEQYSILLLLKSGRPNKAGNYLNWTMVTSYSAIKCLY